MGLSAEIPAAEECTLSIYLSDEIKSDLSKIITLLDS